MDLMELSPFGGETTKPALPAIPSFVVGFSEAIPPTIRKPKNAFLGGLVLRKHEVIEQELEDEVTALDSDPWILAVRLCIPTFVQCCEGRRHHQLTEAEPQPRAGTVERTASVRTAATVGRRSGAAVGCSAVSRNVHRLSSSDLM